MKLLYKNTARIDLESFVDHYEEAFRELYRDSGLWNEANIVEGYKKNATNLYDAIASAIDARLGESQVVGRKRLGYNWYEIGLYVGSRLVIVHYSEDKKESARLVESISIDRKPIVF